LSLHAYFAEKDQLLEVLDDWPGGMGVAVLLEEDTGYHMSLYHVDEREKVLDRLCTRMNLTRDEMVIVSPEGVGPSGEGFARVKIRFSEDREIMDLIAKRRSLPERARDYRINFEYARDQGLDGSFDAQGDPDEDLTFAPIPPKRKENPEAGQDEAGWFEDGGAPPRGRPERFVPERETEEDLTSFDIPAGAEVSDSYRVRSGQMRVVGDLVEIRVLPAGRAGIEIREVEPIGFRDDLSDVLLGPEAGTAPPEGAGLRLHLPRDAFPADFLGRGGAAPRRVRIASTPWGVRVRPVPGVYGLFRPWLRPFLIGMTATLLLALAAGLIGLSPSPVATGFGPADAIPAER
jgi:hypothetical protein